MAEGRRVSEIGSDEPTREGARKRGHVRRGRIKSGTSPVETRVNEISLD